MSRETWKTVLEKHILDYLYESVGCTRDFTLEEMAGDIIQMVEDDMPK